MGSGTWRRLFVQSIAVALIQKLLLTQQMTFAFVLSREAGDER